MESLGVTPDSGEGEDTATPAAELPVSQKGHAGQQERKHTQQQQQHTAETLSTPIGPHTSAHRRKLEDATKHLWLRLRLLLPVSCIAQNVVSVQGRSVFHCEFHL